MDEEGRSRVPSSHPSLSGFFVREMERAGRRGVIKLCYVEWEKRSSLLVFLGTRLVMRSLRNSFLRNGRYTMDR